MYDVIGIRYRNATRCEGDERSVDALFESGAFADHGRVPTLYTPNTDGLTLSDDVPHNIGLFNARIADAVCDIRASGKRVIMIGGDCSHTTGVYAGLVRAHGANARIGLVWFDAHGDFNTTQTTLSGMLGGMPVAVCAGLTQPRWREAAGIHVPLATNRIVMVDVRNLDPAEETLVRATDVNVVPCEPVALRTAMLQLMRDVDYVYLHIDEDILDARYVPNHGTAEPNGPDMAQVCAAIDVVADVAGSALIAQALVSVYNSGAGAETSVASGVSLLRQMTSHWQQ
jgi:arginase